LLENLFFFKPVALEKKTRSNLKEVISDPLIGLFKNPSGFSPTFPAHLGDIQKKRNRKE